MTSGLGVLMLGAAGLMLSSASRWLGWTALVLACALFIPFADFFAMMATGIWIVVVSVALARAKTEPAYAVAVGTP